MKEILERMEKIEALIPSDPKSFLANLSQEEFLELREKDKAITQELLDLGEALFTAIDQELFVKKNLCYDEDQKFDSGFTI